MLIAQNIINARAIWTCTNRLFLRRHKRVSSDITRHRECKQGVWKTSWSFRCIEVYYKRLGKCYYHHNCIWIRWYLPSVSWRVIFIQRIITNLSVFDLSMAAIFAESSWEIINVRLDNRYEYRAFIKLETCYCYRTIAGFYGELKVLHPACNFNRSTMNKTSFRVGEAHYLRSYVLTCAI